MNKGLKELQGKEKAVTDMREYLEKVEELQGRQIKG
jgi:hypothetical protein